MMGGVDVMPRSAQDFYTALVPLGEAYRAVESASATLMVVLVFLSPMPCEVVSLHYCRILRKLSCHTGPQTPPKIIKGAWTTLIVV